MATKQKARPGWYTRDDDTAWERVKAAFRRDWRQTKHDFGGHEPDLNQQVGDTVSQAAGRESIPSGNMPNSKHTHSGDHDMMYRDEDEPAYRYGYAAYRHYGDTAGWEETEARLRKDLGDEVDWDHQSHAVRRGWMFGKQQCGNCK